MTGVGQTGRARPKTKSGDYDRAIELLTLCADAKVRKQHLVELRDAKVAAEEAREAAQGAERQVASRTSIAQAAESAATRARQVLADETAAARADLDTRDTNLADREHAVTETEAAQAERDRELARREDHLRKAGVANF